MPRQLPPGFFDRVSRLRRQISIGIQSGLSTVRDLDLTLVQSLALLHLGEEGPSTVSALQAVVQRSQSSTSALIDQLEQRSLVERRRSATDGRSREVHLTTSGRAVVDAFDQAREDGLRRTLAEVPLETLRRFDEAIAEVLKALPE